MKPSSIQRAPVACAALVLLASGCSKASQAADAAAGPPAEPPRLVRVAPVELRTVQRVVKTTAYLQSEHTVGVLSKVPGRVAEVLVDEGERVAEGQLLARLDDREARSAMRQVQVQLQERRVRKELAELEVQAAERRVEQARIELQKAEADYRRNREIDPGLISAKELEDSKFALDEATEALLIAEFNHKKSLLDVNAAATQIADLEARLDSEELRIADHEIRSPLTGVIESRSVLGGETISTATELFVAVDRDHLVSYLRRPQRELPLVSMARDVVFTTEAFPDRTFHAIIDVVSPTVDEQTGSFQMRIRVAEGDVADLRPGMFIRAEILTEAEREAVMVPKSAVLNERDKAIVFTVRDGIAHRVVLEPGIEEQDWIECARPGDGDLTPGAVVVVAGHHDLKDKTPVEVSKG